MVADRKGGGLVPSDDDPLGDYADPAALYASVVPVFGGVVSQVLTGWSAERRYQRVREVLGGLAEDLEQVKDRVRDEYVRSDEFVELLDQTLQRVARERNAEKRRLYRRLLFDAVTSKLQFHDDHLQMLRIIESLQEVHIALLRAVIAEPEPGYRGGFTSTFMSTLSTRMSGLSEDWIREDRIANIVAQLNEHRVINLGNLHTMMTSEAAADMRSMLTPIGHRLVAYLKEEADNGTTR